jgi:glyoxylase-like metal-dependent hydrolase (beta-lactamase superfamily II)
MQVVIPKILEEGMGFYKIRYSRKCIIIFYGIFFLFSFSAQILGQAPSSKHFQLQQLSEGVYAAIHSFGGYAICNAGIIDLGDKVLIFDPFMTPDAADDLRKAAKTLTSSPIAFVVNSHFHNDHIRGNQVFSQTALISTKGTRDGILKHEALQIEYEKEVAPKRLSDVKATLQNEKDEWTRKELTLWLGYYQGMIESHPKLTLTVPNITFEDKLTIHGNQRTVELISFGRGHTESDLFLHLPDEKIAFMGDLLFIGMHPWLADGDPDSWISVLTKVKELGVETVVPGHGPVGNAEDISTMISYIKTMEQVAEGLIDKGKTKEDISLDYLPEQFKDWWLRRFFPLNLQFMYERIVARQSAK